MLVAHACLWEVWERRSSNGRATAVDVWGSLMQSGGNLTKLPRLEEQGARMLAPIIGFCAHVRLCGPTAGSEAPSTTPFGHFVDRLESQIARRGLSSSETVAVLSGHEKVLRVIGAVPDGVFSEDVDPWRVAQAHVVARPSLPFVLEASVAKTGR